MKQFEVVTPCSAIDVTGKRVPQVFEDHPFTDIGEECILSSGQDPTNLPADPDIIQVVMVRTEANFNAIEADNNYPIVPGTVEDV